MTHICVHRHAKKRAQIYTHVRARTRLKRHMYVTHMYMFTDTLKKEQVTLARLAAQYAKEQQALRATEQVRVYAYVNIHVHTYMHTYIHSYKRTYIHVSTPTYIHTHTQSYVQAVGVLICSIGMHEPRCVSV